MTFEKFTEAGRYARSIRKERESALASTEPRERQKEAVEIGSPLYKYIFDLQKKVERQGGMDYRTFAREMWRDFLQEYPDEHAPAFREFEDKLVVRLHAIDMRKLVYEDVSESMGPFIQKYANGIKHVSLWSLGDVAATGYQAAKIESSGIVKDVFRELLRALPADEARRVFRDKTSYMVSDDKMGLFSQFIGKKLQEDPNAAIKVVIVDDSVKNFAKARDRIETDFGTDAAKRVEIVPVWATYSREGALAKEKAETAGTPERFEEEKRAFNAIDSFKDLLDEGRFKSILDAAYVFIDFDGVIGDNVAMRSEQADAIVSSFLEAASGRLHESASNVREKILKTLEKLP